MVDEAWKLSIDGQDRQWALTGAPGGTLSACPLPGGPSLKIDLETQEALKYLFCFLLLDWTYDDTKLQKYTW